jgi:hypothetical protein
VGREADGWAWEKGGGPREEEGGASRVRPRPRRVGQKLEMGPSSKRNSFRISIDFRIWQNFGNLHKEI